MLAFAVAITLLSATKPVTLAEPEFVASKGSEELGRFAAEHFAQRLLLKGLRVITAAEISTVLGMERQKQLLGCSEGSSCLVEFAGALNADGLVMGSLNKLDELLVVNVKVINASDASLLAVFSGRAKSQAELVDVLEAGAEQVALAVLTRLGKPPGTRWGVRQWAVVPGALGVALLGGGATLYGLRFGEVSLISQARGPRDVVKVFTAARNGEQAGLVGGALISVGAIAAVAAAAMYLFGGDTQVVAFANPSGFTFGLVGVFP